MTLPVWLYYATTNRTNLVRTITGLFIVWYHCGLYMFHLFDIMVYL